ISRCASRGPAPDENRPCAPSMHSVSRSAALRMRRPCPTTAAGRRKSGAYRGIRMARDLDAKCRQCRREGEKLFLKGEKCFTDKCAIERRSYAPGHHGQKSGGRMSDFGKQLREKQKLRRIYG